MMIFASALILGFQGSLSRGLPAPTGKNGYEEYVAAAELLRGPEAGVYAGWHPGAKPPERDPEDPLDRGPDPAIVKLYAHLAKMTPLEVRREELSKYGRALTLVAQGNLKPVFDPRRQLGPETLFPELASFKGVARFAARAATVYAADGQTGKAVDVLCDELLFADNAGRGVIISNLMGVADAAITISAFGDLLPRLSQPDAARIERTVAEILQRRPAVREALPAEMAFTAGALKEVFDKKVDPRALIESSDDASPEEKRMMREFAAMSPTARQALRARVEHRIASRYATMDRVFDRPEREWVLSISQLSDESALAATDMGDILFDMLAPVFPGTVVSAVRTRTQFRLLDLHAKLIQYRWEYGRLPDTLNMTDPLTNAPYVYERLADGTVRLASKGIKETGEIELRYKRQNSDTTGEKP